MSIAIEKLHAGYKLTASPHRSLALTAQDLRDIYDWCLSHMRELEAASTSAQEYTLYWHPSQMYTARLAYGNDRPLWGSERLEVLHEGRWIVGKAGHVGAGSGLVLWPFHKRGHPDYIPLTVGSLVRHVSEPQGDGWTQHTYPTRRRKR